MATRYFKKHAPNVALWMSNGHHVTFPTLDNRIGYLTSDDPQINGNQKMLDDIDAAIKAQRGAVSEITAADYEELWVKKKASKQSLPGSVKPWREEMSLGTSPDTMSNPLGKPKVAAEPSRPESKPDEPEAPPKRSLKDRARVGRF
jgi:hypothetical protein